PRRAGRRGPWRKERRARGGMSTDPLPPATPGNGALRHSRWWRYTGPVPKTSARSLMLRPADPFDLIRWLARSQSDPRKAVAELGQNSIDAHARRVVVSRRRLRGGPALTVRDDGEGVLPGLDREEALRYIATNIGSSRKRSLSPEQRHRLVITGQYGV